VPPTFFPTAARFRQWLQQHHASARELLVGFHRVGSGKPSMTYPQALDAALCFGWIDGVRRSLGATSYTIRFTPRKRDSVWSAVNIRHVARLQAAGLMRPAGLKVFRERDRAKAKRYSHENRRRRLDPASVRAFKAHRRAWAWFEAQAPWYRRNAAWWVMSAKQEGTRARRLATLIASSADGTKALPFILGPQDRQPAARR
jgi:uncharacterized protein YdeI (YjbR/CyaY-like superfamily)